MLLCPTITSLKQQLLACEKFSEDYNILFNARNSKVLCFGESVTINLSFQGNRIPQVDCIKHLGNLVGSNAHFINKCQIESACHELYRKLNVLNNQFNYASEDVKFNLFKSHCLSLYGCQLWDFSSTAIEKVAVAWRKSVRHIYNIHQQTHCDLLPFICQDTPIMPQYIEDFLNFLFHSGIAVTRLYLLVQKYVCTVVVLGYLNL